MPPRRNKRRKSKVPLPKQANVRQVREAVCNVMLNIASQMLHYSRMLQNKVIKTRLIQISKTLDYYIYKNDKLITVEDAEKYIEEVGSYKVQCYGDERSLQVIEKITRCMKAVIAEKLEKNNGNAASEITYTVTNCPSPVYSLLDENEMFSQPPIEVNLNNEQMIISNGIETIDLSDDDDVVVNKQMQVEVEIHRAMSNLSVVDDNDSLHVTPDVFSQSILENFNSNNALNDKVITSTSNRTEKSNKTPNTMNGPIRGNLLNTLVVNNTIKPDNNESLMIKNVRNLHDQVHENINKKGTKDNKTSKDEYKKNKVKSTPKKRTTKAKCKKSGNGLRNTCDDAVQIINSDTQNNINIYTPGVTKAGAIYKRKYTKQTTIANSINIPYDKTVKKTIPKIYNKAVENDLSWMETIRFVREVNQDEFEPVVSSLDSFWDNFEFPDNWDNRNWDI